MGRRRRGQILVILLGLLGSWQPCQAADFTCTSTSGVGDVACLIAAINEANANGEANTITLAAGTYTLTSVNNTTDGGNGLPSITSTLTLIGAGAEATILARAATPEFRLVHVAASGDLTLNRVTLRGGFLVGRTGGGLFNQGGMVTLTQSTVTENGASEGGGGLFNQGGTVTLTQSTVARNSAFGGGGGLGNRGGTMTLRQSLVDENTSRVGVGGLSHTGGTLTITHSRLSGNATINGEGGIFAGAGTVTLTQSTITDNAGSTTGGIATNADTVITDSAVLSNIGQDGAGIGNRGRLRITNSTVAYNGGFDSGGLENDAGTTVILNGTIADNPSAGVGGIRVRGGTVTLQNTILARNTGGPLAADCSSGVTSLGNNLIGDPAHCPITLQGTDRMGDPGLDAFTDDGTPGNGHFPLLSTSQAINAGTETTACPPTDQVGQPRVGRCDIGAIEFQPSDTTPTSDHHRCHPGDPVATERQASPGDGLWDNHRCRIRRGPAHRNLCGDGWYFPTETSSGDGVAPAPAWGLR
jgi:hypothetical protein